MISDKNPFSNVYQNELIFNCQVRKLKFRYIVLLFKVTFEFHLNDKLRPFHPLSLINQFIKCFSYYFEKFFHD